jgi:hypothetical protein
VENAAACVAWVVQRRAGGSLGLNWALQVRQRCGRGVVSGAAMVQVSVADSAGLVAAWVCADPCKCGREVVSGATQLQVSVAG